MRQFTLKCVGLLAGLTLLAAAPANAGDLHHGYKDGPYMHEGMANWSGIYIGAAVGYSFSSSKLQHDWTIVSTVTDRYTIDEDGMNGTLTVGFDRQTAGPLVWGLFADYTFGDIKDTIFLATAPDEALRFRLEDSWAFGGRLGIVHYGALWYMTAGYTGTNVSFADLDETLHGYFIGAGIEKDIGRNFRLKLEYRFADYGSETLFSGTTECCDTRIKVDSEVHSVRLGLSYVFGHREEVVYHEPLK